jgi:hypothetical protein
MLARVLRCGCCDCASAEGRGWLAFLAQDPEEDPWPFVAVYCPPCAFRELGSQPRVTGYT